MYIYTHSCTHRHWHARFVQVQPLEVPPVRYDAQKDDLMCVTGVCVYSSLSLSFCLSLYSKVRRLLFVVVHAIFMHSYDICVYVYQIHTWGITLCRVSAHFFIRMDMHSRFVLIMLDKLHMHDTLHTCARLVRVHVEFRPDDQFFKVWDHDFMSDTIFLLRVLLTCSFVFVLFLYLCYFICL